MESKAAMISKVTVRLPPIHRGGLQGKTLFLAQINLCLPGSIKKFFRLADRKFACGSAVTLLKLFVCGLSLKPIGTFGGRQRGANVNDCLGNISLQSIGTSKLGVRIRGLAMNSEIEILLLITLSSTFSISNDY